MKRSERDERILQLRGQGMRMRDIARQLGCGVGTIDNVAKRAFSRGDERGKPLQAGQRVAAKEDPNHWHHEALRARQAGDSYDAIALRLGKSKTAVWNAVANMRRRARGEPVTWHRSRRRLGG